MYNCSAGIPVHGYLLPIIYCRGIHAEDILYIQLLSSRYSAGLRSTIQATWTNSSHCYRSTSPTPPACTVDTCIIIYPWICVIDVKYSARWQQTEAEIRHTSRHMYTLLSSNYGLRVLPSNSLSYVSARLIWTWCSVVVHLTHALLGCAVLRSLATEMLFDYLLACPSVWVTHTPGRCFMRDFCPQDCSRPNSFDICLSCETVQYVK